MKRLHAKVMVLAVALSSAAAMVSFADTADFGAKGAEGKTTLSVEQMLTYAIQDEYLAQAEIDSIAMYESFLKTDLPEDVRDLFERLQQASENHLRAFRNNLNRYN